jgi:DNA-binding CsgD family transcriptional regulator
MSKKLNTKDFCEEYKKNISYTAANDIKAICTPFFNIIMPASYFSYGRIYNDGTMIILCSHRKWVAHYVKHGYQFLPDSKSGTFLWTTTMHKKAITEGAKHFNLHNGAFIGKSCQGFMEFLEFASSDSEKHPVEFLCNQKDLLNQFYFYFKDKAKSIIKKADKNRLLPPQELLRLKNFPQQYQNMQMLCRVKKFSMHFQNIEIFFSPREFEILSLLSNNKTMMEIAEQLNLSLRTIETHVQNAKNKTNFATKTQLLAFFADNLLF